MGLSKDTNEPIRGKSADRPCLDEFLGFGNRIFFYRVKRSRLGLLVETSS